MQVSILNSINIFNQFIVVRDGQNQFESQVGVTWKIEGVWMMELPPMSEYFVCQVEVIQQGNV